jgi:hypothetical protein
MYDVLFIDDIDDIDTSIITIYIYASDNPQPPDHPLLSTLSCLCP